MGCLLRNKKSNPIIDASVVWSLNVNLNMIDLKYENNFIDAHRRIEHIPIKGY